MGCRTGGAAGPTAIKKSPEDPIDVPTGFVAHDLVRMNIKNEAEGRKPSQGRP